MRRRAPFPPLGLVGLALIAVNPGCDTAADLPPPPSGSARFGGTADADRPPSGDAEIVMVIPSAPSGEELIWEQSARAEVGEAKALFRLQMPGPDGAGRLADSIRAAARQGPGALMVIASDPTEVAPALAEARDRKVPIVLLDRPVPLEGPGGPAHLVTHAPFGESARALVKAAREDADKEGFPAEAPALLLIDSRPDGHSGDRVAALEAALRAEGVTFHAVRFDGTLPGATEVIKSELKGHPDLAMVLHENDTGLSAAVILMEGTVPDRPFAVAGYVAQPKNLNLVALGGCSALADCGVVRLGRRAAQAALSLSRGEAVPDRIEVPIEVQRTKVRPFRSKLWRVKKHMASEAVSDVLSPDSTHGPAPAREAGGTP